MSLSSSVTVETYKEDLGIKVIAFLQEGFVIANLS